MDGDQVRRTVKSINDLTSANEKTSRQLFKEVKEAAELYSNVKRDYYKHTTNPLTIPLNKDQQQLSQSLQLEKPQFQTKEDITFNIGTDVTPPPIIKKQNYKHPTPPDATADKHDNNGTNKYSTKYSFW